MLSWQAVVSVTGTAEANAVTAVTGTGRAMEADFSIPKIVQMWLEDVGRSVEFSVFSILTSPGFQVCEIGGFCNPVNGFYLTGFNVRNDVA